MARTWFAPTGLAFTVPALALGSAAMAGQPSGPVERPIRVSAGLNLLIGGDEKDAFRQNGFRLGAAYQLGAFSFAGQSAPYFIEVGYARHERSGNRLTVLSAELSTRVPLGVVSDMQPGNFYSGIGVGLAYVDGKVNAGGTGGTGGGGGGTGGSGNALTRGFNPNTVGSFKGTRLTGSLMFGYEFKQGAFLEASYRLVGSVEGVSGNSFGVVVGFRF